MDSYPPLYPLDQMPKVLVGANSAALNADIIALFAEEDLDPIKEMILMAKEGHPYIDPETRKVKYLPLDPDQRFRVLKELAEYVAPKIKSVDVSEKRKQKTVIKIMKHGEKAVIANGSNVMEIEGPQNLDKEVREATSINEDVRAAARIDAYGGFNTVREAAQEAEIIPAVKVKDVTGGN